MDVGDSSRVRLLATPATDLWRRDRYPWMLLRNKGSRKSQTLNLISETDESEATGFASTGQGEMLNIIAETEKSADTLEHEKLC